MVRGSRYAYVVLSWVFVAGLLAQVLFVGLAMFSDPKVLELHRTFGWILHLWPLVILLFAFLSRAGSRLVAVNSLSALSRNGTVTT